MKLGWEIITEPDELERLRVQWTDLLCNSSANEPVLTPEWLLCWWSVYAAPQQRQLVAVVVRQNGALVGLAPLSWRRTRYRNLIPIRQLDLVGSGENQEDECCSCYIGAVSRAGLERPVAAAVIDAICSATFPAWDMLCVPEMDGNQQMPELLAQALRAHGCKTQLRTTDHALYVSLPDSWDGYLGGLSRKRRYFVRKTLRDFEQWSEGTHLISSAECRDDLPEALSILKMLHTERWRASGARGAFASALFSRFHEDVLGCMVDKQAARLRWLTAFGKPVAATYEIIWNNKVFVYQAGRTVGLPNTVRPGIALFLYSIRDAIDRGFREYDLLCGNTRYKRQLAAQQRPLLELDARRPTVAMSTCALLDASVKLGQALRRRKR